VIVASDDAIEKLNSIGRGQFRVIASVRGAKRGFTAAPKNFGRRTHSRNSFASV